jgi:hypothetical protein
LGFDALVVRFWILMQSLIRALFEKVVFRVFHVHSSAYY